MIDAQTATRRLKTLIDAIPDDIKVPLEMIAADIKEKRRKTILYRLIKPCHLLYRTIRSHGGEG